jgi:hypothetical protein
MWLEQSHFISLIRRGAGENAWNLSLVHDRMGDPLIRWAETAAGSAVPTWSTRAWIGERWLWLREDQLDEFPESLVVNARWLHCEVTAFFRHVTFVNCDFRGTQFRNCLMEGVTFVNCLLDNVTFVGSQFRGALRQVESPASIRRILVPQDSEPDENRLPVYEVTASHIPDGQCVPKVVSEWLAYRTPKSHAKFASDALTSPMAGLPAGPRLKEWPRDLPAPEAWGAATAGVRVYGGRVNSLTVESCSFEGEASMSLIRAAGSSLDFVENETLQINVVKCAIRGFAVTAPLADARDRDPKAHVSIAILDSALFDTWFGHGLRGRVVVDTSQVVNLTNLSRDWSSPSGPLNVYLLDISCVQAVGATEVSADGKYEPDVLELRETHGSDYFGPLPIEGDELASGRANPRSLFQRRGDVQRTVGDLHLSYFDNATKMTYRAEPARFDVGQAMAGGPKRP